MLQVIDPEFFKRAGTAMFNPVAGAVDPELREAVCFEWHSGSRDLFFRGSWLNRIRVRKQSRYLSLSNQQRYRRSYRGQFG